MRLIIAEKPDLARNKISPALGIDRKEKNAIYLKNGDVVIWLVGHILEQASPDEYIDAPVNEKGKKPWRKEDLPIIPQHWKLFPSKGKKEILDNVRKWLKQADTVINAGDPDREGQLLVDEVLEYLGFKGKVLRVWLTDLTPAAIRKSFDNLKSNEEYRGLMQSALARSRADWLIGMNATRAMTLKQAGRGVLSIGRVQTPTLNLIVMREQAIQNFKPKDFYEVYAGFSSRSGAWRAKWQPPASVLSDDNYLLDKRLAQQVADDVDGKTGEVVRVETKRKKTQPPLPFSLSDLQKHMGKWGLEPSQTLKIVQKLYEDGILTYPRTDCNYLEEGRHAEASDIFKQIDGLINLPSGWDVSRKSRAFNDKRVTAHTAIVPTLEASRAKSLTGVERTLFDEVAKRYAAQFYPPYEYDETVIETKVEEHLFKVTGQVMSSPGWKVLYGASEGNDATGDGKKEDDKKLLPKVSEGEQAKVDDVDVITKTTQPPKRFTLSEMSDVMKNAARYADIKDEQYKKLLNESEGLGTEATRGTIIDTLKKRDYVQVSGKRKEVSPTEKGEELIAIVPNALKDVATTAIWEKALSAIEKGALGLGDFLKAQEDMTRAVVQEILNGKDMKSVQKDQGSIGKTVFSPCPRCKEGEIVDKGKLWACSRKKDECDFIVWKEVARKKLTEKQLVELLSLGETGPVKGLRGKKGTFSAKLSLDVGSAGPASIKFIFED